MPLVKRPSGWFWGSKGPFDSKAKALAVARAAYAGGYKGEAYSAADLRAIEESVECGEISESKSEKFCPGGRLQKK